jgi:hypothetical protein
LPAENRPVPPTNGVASPASQLSARPNLRNSIFAGRQEALMNQPWRAGYNTNIQGPEDENGVPSVITTPMSPIYPNFSPPIQSPLVSEESDYGDRLTPRQPTIRRRKPIEEEAY